MPARCDDCPFSSSGPGLALRKVLRPGRWAEILAGLRNDRHFYCHKTTTACDEEDESVASVGKGAKVCAGSLEWSERHGVSQNFVRVCMALDYFRARREERAKAAAAAERRR